jgi:hypothetical protein
VVDLKSPAGVAGFLALSDTADVVVEAFRPGVVRTVQRGAAAGGGLSAPCGARPAAGLRHRRELGRDAQPDRADLGAPVSLAARPMSKCPYATSSSTPRVASSGVGSPQLPDAAGAGIRSPGNLPVPSDALRPLMGDLLTLGKRYGRPGRPWLGVTSREVGAEVLVAAGVRNGQRERHSSWRGLLRGRAPTRSTRPGRSTTTPWPRRFRRARQGALERVELRRAGLDP